ncbi:putative alkaline shock family protein YloU [Enterococcus rotai]|uniref:Stress response regulator gls24 homolog n=1 Tax=Enterococcus rotai TaxID=118060 RepID=A0A0U2WWT9_9ENTE|nr:Asp23/Gls24 family envelope stress response protein [Enterococcus rotai]ALS36474.1 stress response regulator Gls24 [Enterococcus rotai]
MDNKNLPKKEEASVNGIKGELTYDDKVIQKIIGIALESVDGLLTVEGGFFSNVANKLVNREDVTTGIDVEVGKKQVAVDLDVVTEYGRDIAALYEKIKEVISREVEKMTSLKVVEVNVTVTDVKSKEQYEEDSTTVQDRLSDATESVSNFTSEQTEKAKKVASNGVAKAKDATESRVQ